MISVGASAVVLRRDREGDAARPLVGDATGCSGQTPVAKSSIEGKRSSGSLERDRAMAALREPGVPGRLVFTSGGSS